MLIIFDCDGVLVDSEILASKVFSTCLANVAIKLSPEQCYEQFRGQTLEYCFAWLELRFSQKLPGNFASTLAHETEKTFQLSLKPVEGIVNLLKKLQARSIPFCVASNGSHEKIEHSLRVTSLLHFFRDTRFSRADVVRGKPAPDLFLFAADSIGVPPEYCVVVEDSEAGLRGALDAGMRVHYFQARQCQRLKQANPLSDRVTIFAHMEELSRQLLAY